MFFLLQLLQVLFSSLAAVLQISISQTTIRQEYSNLVRIRAHLQPQPSLLAQGAFLFISPQRHLQWGKRLFVKMENQYGKDVCLCMNVVQVKASMFSNIDLPYYSLGGSEKKSRVCMCPVWQEICLLEQCLFPLSLVAFQSYIMTKILNIMSHVEVFIFHRSNGKNMFSSSGTSVSGRKIKTAVRRRK